MTEMKSQMPGIVQNKICLNIINSFGVTQIIDQTKAFGKSSGNIDLKQEVRGRKLENQVSVFISDSSCFTDRGIIGIYII